MLCPKATFLILFACLPSTLPAQDAGNGDLKERVKEARALGEQDSAAIPALKTLAQDQEFGVRLEAVKSIVKIGTQHSLDPLVISTGDAEPEIQIRATDGLVNFYLPGYVRTGLTASLKRAGTSIKGKFTDINDQIIPPYLEVRPGVIEALGKVTRGGSDMTARANAARALGILRGKAAIPDLLDALRSKNSAVLLESLIAIQKIRDPSAAPGITFLLRDLDDKVQIAAIETTGLLQNREALPQLHDALNNSRNKKIRRAALTSIAMLPDNKSRPIYVRYIRDKDALTRAAAAEGFARLKNSADVSMLEDYFVVEKKMNPRLSLAFALTLMGKTDLTEFSPLRYLVNTLNSASFHGVAEPFLIEASREATVRKSLYKILSSGTRLERIRLTRILGASGDEETVSYLEKQAKDADIEIATEGMQALRDLRARLK